MKDLKVTRIEKRFAGYGHNNITVTVTGKLINDYGEEKDVENYQLKCTSTNTMATDAYFDDRYDDDLANEGAYYETRYEAGSSLVDEVFRKNQVESDYEIDDDIPTPDEVKEMREQIKAENSADGC